MVRCLCCGQLVRQPGQPVTEERAARAYAALCALGWRREALLTEHRSTLDYVAPGLVEWLERQAARSAGFPGTACPTK